MIKLWNFTVALDTVVVYSDCGVYTRLKNILIFEKIYIFAFRYFKHTRIYKSFFKKMVDVIIGEWKLTSSENFDALMRELGVGFFLRKLGNTIKPNIRFEKDEKGVWTMTTISSVKTHAIKFELDKEFEEETIDGRKVKSVISADPENKKKFIHTQRDAKTNDVICVITREVNEKDEYVSNVRAGNVVAKRMYNRA